MTNKNKKNGLK